MTMSPVRIFFKPIINILNLNYCLNLTIMIDSFLFCRSFKPLGPLPVSDLMLPGYLYNGMNLKFVNYYHVFGYTLFFVNHSS
jgi:hypothetical protein